MEDNIGDILQRGANDVWRLGLTSLQIDQFERFAGLLMEWNATRMNLTGLTRPRDIAVKHFLDSLALLTMFSIPQKARVIDVGAGAGLPGLALKIARPDLRLTLLDSTAKKLVFCRAVVDDLGLPDVETLHARAEEAGRQPDQAGAYDLAVARAVAPLDKLLLWCAPFVRPGGHVAALKGPGVTEELVAGRPVARKLGLTLFLPSPFRLPESEEENTRQIVLARRS